MSKKLTVSACKDKLSAKGDFGTGMVFFDGRYLGRFVTHGDRSGNGKTVYASRIVKPLRIEVEASSRSSMLNKAAALLARHARENKLASSEIGMELE